MRRSPTFDIDGPKAKKPQNAKKRESQIDQDLAKAIANSLRDLTVVAPHRVWGPDTETDSDSECSESEASDAKRHKRHQVPVLARVHPHMQARECAHVLRCQMCVHM